MNQSDVYLPVDPCAGRPGELSRSRSFIAASRRAANSRVRVYEVDISRPDNDLKFTLCASLDLPFYIRGMDILGDRLFARGSFNTTPSTHCDTFWDYKTKQYVVWVQERTHDQVGRVSFPSPVVLCPSHAGFTLAYSLGCLVL